MSNLKIKQNSDLIEVSKQDEIQEMLGNPPGWILHSGISVIFLGTLVFIVLSAIIKYPDKLEAQVIIRTENAPTEIVAPSIGILDSIFVKDGMMVKEKDVLALIKNSAKLEDVLIMENIVDSLRSSESFGELPNTFTYKDLILGNMQASFAKLSQTIKELKYLNDDVFIKEQISSITDEILQLQRLNTSLLKQEKIFEAETMLVQKDFERELKLFQENVISEQEKEKAEISYLVQKRNLEQIQTSRIQNDMKIEQLVSQKNNIRNNYKKEKHEKAMFIIQQCEALKGEIQRWKDAVLISAPIAGKIIFNPSIGNKMAVNSQELLFTILLPKNNNNKVFAYCQLPVTGSGKIQMGTSGQIFLDEWPHKEYGSIEAEVVKIAAIPQKTETGYNYNVRLALKNKFYKKTIDSLKTTYNISIPFNQNMSGNVNLITEDKSILKRIFQQIHDLIKNK